MGEVKSLLLLLLFLLGAHHCCWPKIIRPAYVMSLLYTGARVRPSQRKSCIRPNQTFHVILPKTRIETKAKIFCTMILVSVLPTYLPKVSETRLCSCLSAAVYETMTLCHYVWNLLTATRPGRLWCSLPCPSSGWEAARSAGSVCLAGILSHCLKLGENGIPNFRAYCVEQENLGEGSSDK